MEYIAKMLLECKAKRFFSMSLCRIWLYCFLLTNHGRRNSTKCSFSPSKQCNKSWHPHCHQHQKSNTFVSLLLQVRQKKFQDLTCRIGDIITPQAEESWGAWPCGFWQPLGTTVISWSARITIRRAFSHRGISESRIRAWVGILSLLRAEVAFRAWSTCAGWGLGCWGTDIHTYLMR